MGRARRRHTLIQFIKFGLVGGSGFLVNILVAFVMNKLHGGSQNANQVLGTTALLNWEFTFSNLVWIVGFLIANPFNFEMNRLWTFKSKGHGGWWAEFGPFFLVGIVAAVVGYFLKDFMAKKTGSWIYLRGPLFQEAGLRSREYWSQIFAIVLTIPINFLVNKVWTFRSVRHLTPGNSPTDLKD